MENGTCDKKMTNDSSSAARANDTKTTDQETNRSTVIGDGNTEGTAQYWKTKYEQLRTDFDHLQRVNQNLEDKLLTVVETFEKKREELVANVEYEKSTLMADVNKLSTKLVDARIKLHDFEEKEILHAAECNAPCHKATSSSSTTSTTYTSNNFSQSVPPPINPIQRQNGQQQSNNLQRTSFSKLDAKQMEQMANDPNLV